MGKITVFPLMFIFSPHVSAFKFSFSQTVRLLYQSTSETFRPKSADEIALEFDIEDVDVGVYTRYI